MSSASKRARSDAEGGGRRKAKRGRAASRYETVEGRAVWFKANKANGYAFLSNFYPHCSPAALAEEPARSAGPGGFRVAGEAFKSVEHCFHAAKYEGVPEARAEILAAATAPGAKKKNTEWRRKKPIDRRAWEARSEGVMLEAVRAKFGQNEGLRAALLATGEALLCEVPGRGPCRWTGGDREGNENGLGRVLMRVRDELRDEVGEGGVE